MIARKTFYPMVLSVLIGLFTVGSALAQEETTTQAGSDGFMLFVIGFGALVIFGLGAAIAAQNSDDAQTQN
ncbi:MAG: hypothetical protein ACFE0Q_16100 [Anaerolineae bacterium]